jgi:ankyrin repeat protein
MANNVERLGKRLNYFCKDFQNVPSVATLQSLIVKGANVNAKGDDGNSTLHYAVANGHLDAVVTLLTAEGIDICAKNIFGDTPLMYACNIDVVTALLAALVKTSNFDINDKSNRGVTVLMRACANKRVEVVKLLLTIRNIDTHLKHSGGMTALEHAKGRVNEDEMRALFQGELLPIQL